MVIAETDRGAPPIAVLEFQRQVGAWLQACFPGTDAKPPTWRMDRFLEEVLELAQALGYPCERVADLVTYVYGRPVGDPAQETGGVMLTLAALCHTAGLDMHAAGESELARVSTPEKMAAIRAKDAGWSQDSPLPGGASQHGDARGAALTSDRKEQLHQLGKAIGAANKFLPDVKRLGDERNAALIVLGTIVALDDYKDEHGRTEEHEAVRMEILQIAREVLDTVGLMPPRQGVMPEGTPDVS